MSYELEIPRFTESALCAEVDPELFFPEQHTRGSAAKLLCGRCLAREECLAWALAHDERYGVWGGLSPEERERRQPMKAGCGTRAAYQGHRERGESPCAPCRAANAAYHRTRKDPRYVNSSRRAS